MNATNASDSNHWCTVKGFRPAWAVGTGLPVSLKPGKYQITGRGEVDGVCFVYLDGAYHGAADICEENHNPAEPVPNRRAAGVSRLMIPINRGGDASSTHQWADARRSPFPGRVARDFSDKGS